MLLYKHQETILELLTTHNEFGVFCEQGTGKTIPILIHLSNLLFSGKINDALIVAPLAAIGSWNRDIEKLHIDRQRIIRDKVTIINYDKVWRRTEYEKIWGAIVLDEAHSIAHRTSKRSKFLVKLAPLATYKYILTGTPIGNGRLEDYYNLMMFLDNTIFQGYREFSARYLIERRLPGTFVDIVVGYRNESELYGIIGKRTYRVLKKDCLDLPEKLPDIIVDIEIKEKAKYKEAVKNFISEYGMNIGHPLVKVAKLRQICSGFVNDDYGDLHELKCDKIPRLNELLEGILPEKVVIFCEFKYSVDQVSQLLTKNKINFVVLDGRQTDKTIWRQFQSDDKIKVIVCQYLTANSGIDLFASSHMIFYEPNLSTTIISQASDRIHRIGAENHCNYYWLITKDSIEEVIYNKLSKKQDFNAQTLEEIMKRGELR